MISEVPPININRAVLLLSILITNMFYFMALMFSKIMCHKHNILKQKCELVMWAPDMLTL